MINAGFILPHEANRLAYVDGHTAYETTWAPILWAVNLLQRERSAGRITIEAPNFARLIEAFDYIDSCNRQIFNHGWVNFPLGNNSMQELVIKLSVVTFCTKLSM